MCDTVRCVFEMHVAVRRLKENPGFLIHHVYSPRKVSEMREPIFSGYKKIALVLGVTIGVLLCVGAAIFLTRALSSELPSWVEPCFVILCVTIAFASVVTLWVVRNQKLAALGHMEYETASCSSEKDKEEIIMGIENKGGFEELNEHINELRIDQFKDLGFRFDRWFIVLGVMVGVLVMLLLL